MQMVGLAFLLLLLGPVARAAPVDYTAEIAGVSDPALQQLLDNVFDTLAPDASPPASLLWRNGCHRY